MAAYFCCWRACSNVLDLGSSQAVPIRRAPLIALDNNYCGGLLVILASLSGNSKCWNKSPSPLRSRGGDCQERHKNMRNRRRVRKLSSSPRQILLWGASPTSRQETVRSCYRKPSSFSRQRKFHIIVELNRCLGLGFGYREGRSEQSSDGSRPGDMGVGFRWQTEAQQGGTVHHQKYSSRRGHDSEGSLYAKHDRANKASLIYYIVRLQGVSFNHDELNFFINGAKLDYPITNVKGQVFPTVYGKYFFCLSIVVKH